MSEEKLGIELIGSSASNAEDQPMPKKGQTVEVHYTGTLSNGDVFDSSRTRNKPFRFKIGVGEVISGWDQGVMQMRVGKKYRLTCPPSYAYGPDGHPGVIPRNATLTFEVEVLRIVEEDK